MSVCRTGSRGAPRAWEARGGQVLGGLDLLVHQAVFQFRQFTGDPRSPLAAMREAAQQR
ncbi:hypothetical protein [Streptomyces sp. VMFN-G11Ma]|uniref:hypothetical protein n=1 Tax=Streptomyces sp. VMFN-G11Ma TaxID=2135609 RepID=UPI000D4AAC96|nr:hypothetical protein C7821_106113 [Streptomyces sp. VMFN-G11Ma]